MCMCMLECAFVCVYEQLCAFMHECVCICVLK